MWGKRSFVLLSNSRQHVSAQCLRIITCAETEILPQLSQPAAKEQTRIILTKQGLVKTVLICLVYLKEKGEMCMWVALCVCFVSDSVSNSWTMFFVCFSKDSAATSLQTLQRTSYALRMCWWAKPMSGGAISADMYKRWHTHRHLPAVRLLRNEDVLC